MEDIAEAAIERSQSLGAEFTDLRIESVTGVNIVVMDGKTRTVTSRVEKGCGIRSFVGGGWGFAVCNGLKTSDILRTAEISVKLAKVSREKATLGFEIASAPSVQSKSEYPCKIAPSTISTEDKLSFVLNLDKSMEVHDARIVSRSSRYNDFEGERIVASSFGSQVRTKETWTLAACSAWGKSGDVVQRGHEAVGNIGGFELASSEAAVKCGETAAAMAVRLLDSKPVPAGKFTCVLDNKMTGLMAHEAFGHACEADAILSGSSVLEGLEGERVANEGVTLIDDPTVPDTFGYFPFDWEGVKSVKHVLIDKGVLSEFLHNIETSSRMNVPPNGAARSDSYSSPPIIRMSNTYIEPGDVKKDELIADLREGFLIKGAQYGYVEPAKGQFMFKCDEAYEIKNGDVGQRYRDAILTGVILDILKDVTGIADDFELVDPGYCGKSGQDARTTDGGPHIRVDNVVVGGLT
ncbi:MAG: TldD/PmbA family protein [Methanobacteriota archaeon]|nr:MAG: TldD/PmbA family protein [Euryarchaeota archaeon]